MVGNNDVSVALIEPMTGVKEGTLPLMVSAHACMRHDAQNLLRRLLTVVACCQMCCRPAASVQRCTQTCSHIT